VSALSFGSWVSFGYQFGVDNAVELMQKARDYGVNFFDNAEVYSHGKSEIIMGEALKKLNWNRQDYVVSTKIYFGSIPQAEKNATNWGLSRKHIIEGTRASLKRMQLDYVDLIFCHRPDPDTPIEETVRAMNWVIDQGWAFYWGTSEWSAEQLTEAWLISEKLGLMGPVMEQPEYNMYTKQKVEKDYLPLYEKYGLGLTTWSPLKSGILTGKYNSGDIPEGSRFSVDNYKWLGDKILNKENLEKVDKLKPIAEELKCSMAQLALAWCVKNERVSTVITGATKISQIEDNMQALDVVPKLTEEIMQKIADIFVVSSDQKN